MAVIKEAEIEIWNIIWFVITEKYHKTEIQKYREWIRLFISFLCFYLHEMLVLIR